MAMHFTIPLGVMIHEEVVKEANYLPSPLVVLNLQQEANYHHLPNFLEVLDTEEVVLAAIDPHSPLVILTMVLVANLLQTLSSPLEVVHIKDHQAMVHPFNQMIR